MVCLMQFILLIKSLKKSNLLKFNILFWSQISIYSWRQEESEHVFRKYVQIRLIRYFILEETQKTILIT